MPDRTVSEGLGTSFPVVARAATGAEAGEGDRRPIGIFDSGLGGLTVARAISRALPHESVCYIGDTERCPYGTRGEDEVRSFVRQIGAWLTEQDVKVMVIACNTATAAGLSLAQQTFDVPVIGVIVPGARAAIHSTRTRRVGVLATELTIRSGAYTRAIQEFDAGVDVYGCAASEFVDIVEHELAEGAGDGSRWLSADGDVFDTPAVREVVSEKVAPLLSHGIDTVVLGCTHFPVLAGPISSALGPGVRVHRVRPVRGRLPAAHRDHRGAQEGCGDVRGLRHGGDAAMRLGARGRDAALPRRGVGAALPRRRPAL